MKEIIIYIAIGYVLGGLAVYLILYPKIQKVITQYNLWKCGYDAGAADQQKWINVGFYAATQLMMDMCQEMQASQCNVKIVTDDKQGEE